MIETLSSLVAAPLLSGYWAGAFNTIPVVFIGLGISNVFRKGRKERWVSTFFLVALLVSAFDAATPPPGPDLTVGSLILDVGLCLYGLGTWSSKSVKTGANNPKVLEHA